MLEEYCQAIDALTINEENRLKLKVQEITSKTETKYRLQEKEDKLTILAERFNKIQSQMNTLESSATELAEEYMPTSTRYDESPTNEGAASQMVDRGQLVKH